MTRSEFVEGYCVRSKLSKVDFYKYFVAIPCSCDDKSCKGWAAIGLNSLAIESHLALYAPDDIRRYYDRL